MRPLDKRFILLSQGYFRKAEVEVATFNHTDAILSYSMALRLLPSDPTILAALERTTRERSIAIKGQWNCNNNSDGWQV